jgi:hypothetical protein
MATAFADDVGHLLLGIGEAFDQLDVAIGLLDRIEVTALDIFDDRQLQNRAVVKLTDDDGDLVQPGALGGSPAALAGDNLVVAEMARVGPDHDRLDNAALANRGGELVQFGLGEIAAGLVWIGAQPLDWHGGRWASVRHVDLWLMGACRRECGFTNFATYFAQKCRKAASEAPAFRLFAH